MLLLPYNIPFIEVTAVSDLCHRFSSRFSMSGNYYQSVSDKDPELAIELVDRNVTATSTTQADCNEIEVETNIETSTLFSRGLYIGAVLVIFCIAFKVH